MTERTHLDVRRPRSSGKGEIRVIKLLHSSDWHLGKALFAKSLIEDQRTALTELEAMIVDEKPDLVLLAGDLYDRSIPPEEAVRLLDRFLARVVLEYKVPIAMIPGNHDSSTRVGVGAELLRASGLHVFATPDSIATPLKIESGDVSASVYGIPFLEPMEWGFHFQKNLRTHADALEAILDSLKPSLEIDRAEGRRTVLILHAYVTGGEPSESERPLSIGGSDLVPAELLKDFDYVALGHLHRPQTVLHERIRYPGSLFPYSQSEAGQAKGVLIATLAKEKTDDEFRFSPFKKNRGLRVVRGTLDEIVSAPLEKAGTTDVRRDDYIVAILTDSSLPFEAYRRLNQVYPELLHVARDVTWSRDDAEKTDAEARAEKKRAPQEISDREVLGHFVTTAAAQELSVEDREWLLEQFEAFSRQDSENGGTAVTP